MFLFLYLGDANYKLELFFLCDDFLPVLHMSPYTTFEFDRRLDRKEKCNDHDVCKRNVAQYQTQTAWCVLDKIYVPNTRIAYLNLCILRQHVIFLEHRYPGEHANWGQKCFLPSYQSNSNLSTSDFIYMRHRLRNRKSFFLEKSW